MPETMSTPADFSESGRPPVRSPEKKSFSRTCSLLSRYLKEKGSFGDLSLGMTCNVDEKAKAEAFRPTTTMDLLPKMEISGDRYEDVSDPDVKSMELFPQRAGFGPSEDSSNSADIRPKVVEPEKAQMTIFYGGKVHVFNDFPADKAREVMQFAASGVLQKPPASINFIPNNTTTTASSNNAKQPNVLGTGLPLTRNVSLHRFLEKRKERISSKAPYQLHKGEESGAVPQKETKSWLGMTSRQPN